MPSDDGVEERETPASAQPRPWPTWMRWLLCLLLVASCSQLTLREAALWVRERYRGGSSRYGPIRAAETFSIASEERALDAFRRRFSLFFDLLLGG